MRLHHRKMVMPLARVWKGKSSTKKAISFVRKRLMVRQMIQLTICEGAESHIISGAIHKDEAMEHTVRMETGRSSTNGNAHIRTT